MTDAHDLGIVSWGLGIPRYRLSAKVIGENWDKEGGKGEKAVANFDEDSLSLAVEGAWQSMENVPREKIQGLYFASTTAPYTEGSTASLIAATFDLSPWAATADFSGSLRCGTTAFIAACQAIRADLERVLVCAADTRITEPGAELESLLGDGAAAFLLGRENVVARLLAHFSRHDSFFDSWRRDGEKFPRFADLRLAQTQGYMETLTQTAEEFFQRFQLSPRSWAKVILSSPDGKSHLPLAKKLGFSPEQIGDSLVPQIGHTGTAQPLIALIAALESAKPMDKILLLHYGNGCDLVALEVTAEIEKARKCFAQAMGRRSELSSYTKYLRIKGLCAGAKSSEAVFSSPALLARDQEFILQLKGIRCLQCAAVYTIPLQICAHCGSSAGSPTSRFQIVPLSRQGKVFTFTREYYFPSPDPYTTMAVIDLEGGGRMMTQVTDSAEVEIGDEVELVLRKLHTGGGFINYAWKCRKKS